MQHYGVRTKVESSCPPTPLFLEKKVQDSEVEVLKEKKYKRSYTSYNIMLEK
jgi:hypothetical protein